MFSNLEEFPACRDVLYPLSTLGILCMGGDGRSGTHHRMRDRQAWHMSEGGWRMGLLLCGEEGTEKCEECGPG